jgi:hypothetical protein
MLNFQTMLVFNAEIRGKDGKHTITGKAESLFDAAYQTIRGCCRQWWWEPDADIFVRVGDGEWRVRQQKALDWYSSKLGLSK